MTSSINKTKFKKSQKENQDIINDTCSENVDIPINEVLKRPHTLPTNILKLNRARSSRQLRNLQLKASDLDPKEIAYKLGGEILSNGNILVPGPGHSEKDRSLSIKIDSEKPFGYVHHSFAEDDPRVCQDYINDLLNLSKYSTAISENERISLKEKRKERDAANKILHQKKLQACIELFEQSDAAGYYAKPYFEGRGNLPWPEQKFKESQRLINGQGEFYRTKHSSIIAQISDFQTGLPVGLHCTAIQASSLNRNAIGYTVRNLKKQNKSSRQISGSLKGYLELYCGSEKNRTLFVGEGIETTLSLLKLPLTFENPAVWALINASNFTSLLPLLNFNTIVIATDIDPPKDGETIGIGEKSARELAERWEKAGKHAHLVIPIKPEEKEKWDLNDLVMTVDLPVEGVHFKIESVYARKNSVNAHLDNEFTLEKLCLEDAITALNKNYAFTIESGKATVLREIYEPVHNRKQFVRIAPSDFVTAFGNITFEVGSGRNLKTVSLGNAWMKSPKRLQFLDGVVFDPANRYGMSYKNLWEGFAFEPKTGSWERLKEHIRVIVCQNNPDHFAYLIKWMARAVQRPAEQGQVAIVTRGTEGCGKGIVVRALLKLFGSHGKHITNAAHLVGRFNEHLQCTVMLFVDEAFWAGDKAHTGVLKALITEPTFAVEPKYRSVVEAQNYLHIWMASNENWVVPASLEARRFFVVEVSSERKGDFAYFSAIQDELDNGGYSAMLHELLNIDISDFRVSDVPQTAALGEQKKLSLTLEYQWWLDVLHRGYVLKSRYGQVNTLEIWHENVATEMLFEAYSLFAGIKNNKYPLSRETFGKFISKMGSKRYFQSKGILIMGEIMRNGETVVIKNTKPTRGYHFGSLKNARENFCNLTQLQIEWDESDFNSDEENNFPF